MAVVVWLLEQAVWAAPVAGVLLYLSIPEMSRGVGVTIATYALAALFFMNLAGVYPGPSRVSCNAGLPPACTHTTVSVRNSEERRHRSWATSSADTRTGARAGSDQVEDATSRGRAGGSLRAGIHILAAASAGALSIPQNAPAEVARRRTANGCRRFGPRP
jgi:hypothetical protein